MSVGYGFFGAIDGTETVTIFPRSTGDAFLTGFNATGFRRALSRDNAAGGGNSMLGQARLRWHLWPATFNGNTTYVPKARDVIQDGNGVRWTVQSVQTVE